MGNKLGNVRMA